MRNILQSWLQAIYADRVKWLCVLIALAITVSIVALVLTTLYTLPP